MTTGTSVFQRRTHAYDRMQPACRMHTIVCSLHTIVRPLHTIVICSQHTIVCRLHASLVWPRLKRIYNSDKICRSYSDLNFGVTFLEHSVLCMWNAISDKVSKAEGQRSLSHWVLPNYLSLVHAQAGLLTARTLTSANNTPLSSGDLLLLL